MKTIFEKIAVTILFTLPILFFLDVLATIANYDRPFLAMATGFCLGYWGWYFANKIYKS